MEAILKKIFAPKQEKKVIAKLPDEDFIPYVCHYDPSTILTKNGELLQVIRIKGDASSSFSVGSIREDLRDVIFEHVRTNNFAFWIHTIRSKEDLSVGGEYPDFFSQKISNEWIKQNDLKNKYANEIYITILSEGIDTSIKNRQAFMRSLSYKSTFNLHKEFLQESYKNLSKISLKILANIEEYGAQLLHIEEINEILYSQHLEFFGRILNLSEDKYPLAANDIAIELSNHKITFGDREFEISSANGKKFGAIFSIKEYHEIETSALEKILQSPLDFIISQSCIFDFNRQDMANHQYQNEILQISGDEEFRHSSGLANFISCDHGEETDYCKAQNSVTLFSDNKENLEKNINILIEKFGDLGFVLVREDTFLEHCFWAQLPGNFSFLRRQKILESTRIGGFAALHDFPAGIMTDNHWGDAVVTLQTILKTPYFFNFHDRDLGHTLILGDKSCGKTTLINFLLCCSRKFDNRIFYFDFNKSSKVFIQAISGRYHSLTKNIEDPDFLQLNPFSLPKNQENEIFLNEWIKELVMFLKGDIPKNELALVPEIIHKAFALENSSFLSVFDAFSDRTKTPFLYEKLKIWGSGKLAYIFGSNNETDWRNQVHGFDLSEIIEQKPVLIPVISYLLQRVKSMLDGTPTIIVFDEFQEFFDNKIIAPKIKTLLAELRKKNCIVIFSSANSDVSQSLAVRDIKANLATEIYFSNKNLTTDSAKIFDLNEDEINLLRMMDYRDRSFLLKQYSESLIIDFDISKFAEDLKVLSSNEVTIAAIEEIITSLREENPSGVIAAEDWLPQLVKVTKEIEKEMRIIAAKDAAKKVAQNSTQNLDNAQNENSTQ